MSVNKYNVLPLIVSSNQINKSSSLSGNKTQELNNYKNISQDKIELKGKENTSRLKGNKIKNEYKDKNNSNIIEKSRNNYKLVYSKSSKGNKQINFLNQGDNKNNNTTVINEIEQNEKHYKLIPSIYKIIFVFRNEDFYITVKANNTIKNLRLSISKLLNIDINQIVMIYEDKEIDVTNDYKTVDIYFNIKKMKSRPIIYIKKKHLSNSMSMDNLSNNFLFKKIYNNKVKIMNFPLENDNNMNIEENLNDIIHNFFKNNSSTSEGFNENNLFKIENQNESLEEQKNNNTFIIGFSSPDLAFDFNRYLNSLKLINPIYKDIKSNIVSMKKRGSALRTRRNDENHPKANLRYGIDYNLEENDLNKMNSNILKLLRQNYLRRKQLKKEKNSSPIYVNVSGPYLSQIDKERLEEKENKKKWISPEGFISCVGKYSGVQL